MSAWDYRLGVSEVSAKQEVESVDHPEHYNFGKIEVIDVIEDWDLGFHLGNSVKYIARAGKKDPKKEIEDLKKASWYLNRRLQQKEKELAKKEIGEE